MKNLNKKGFTLVELLAVIAILAILMLLVTPNILSMFTEGRKDAFVTQVQSVWRAAEQQYMTKSFSGTASTVFTNLDTSTDNDISFGSTDIKYYVSFDGNGNVAKIGVSDNNYCYFANSGAKINLSASDVSSDNDGKTLSESSGTLSCAE